MTQIISAAALRMFVINWLRSTSFQESLPSFLFRPVRPGRLSAHVLSTHTPRSPHFSIPRRSTKTEIFDAAIYISIADLQSK